jgi:hypothetical protein
MGIILCAFRHPLDPDTPLRNPEHIHYPSKDDPAELPVHTGNLERKKRFTRAYKESYFVLTPLDSSINTHQATLPLTLVKTPSLAYSSSPHAPSAHPRPPTRGPINSTSKKVVCSALDTSFNVLVSIAVKYVHNWLRITHMVHCAKPGFDSQTGIYRNPIFW